MIPSMFKQVLQQAATLTNVRATHRKITDSGLKSPAFDNAAQHTPSPDTGVKVRFVRRGTGLAAAIRQ